MKAVNVGWWKLLFLLLQTIMWKMNEKCFKVTGQGVIHMQGLNQIYFAINLGYEDLMETAT